MEITNSIKISTLALLFTFYYSLSSFSQIDFQWGESFGSKNNDHVSQTIIDSSDNILMAGTFNGKELDNAAFVYYLKMKLINTDAPIFKKGNVSIIE